MKKSLQVSMLILSIMSTKKRYGEPIVKSVAN